MDKVAKFNFTFIKLKSNQLGGEAIKEIKFITSRVIFGQMYER